MEPCKMSFSGPFWHLFSWFIAGIGLTVGWRFTVYIFELIHISPK